nr:unnamed protein product [Spirometra erinaceieuropaei]
MSHINETSEGSSSQKRSHSPSNRRQEHNKAARTDDTDLSFKREGLPICKYGSQCYRKNPHHFLEFAHPESTCLPSSGTSSTSKEPVPPVDSNDSASKYGFYLYRVAGLNYGQLPTITLSETAADTGYPVVAAGPTAAVRRNDASSQVGAYSTGSGHTFNFDKAEILARGDNRARLPMSYGTHHTKMMLLHYVDGMRVVIHTANLIEEDWSYRTQGIWISPKLTTNSPAGDSDTHFRADLLTYLESYRDQKLHHWMELIRKHDFRSINFLRSARWARSRRSGSPLNGRPVSPAEARVEYACANLSKAAWGSLELEKTQLMIRSYELGVLFLPENFQINEQNSEEVPPAFSDFPTPYVLPPSPYAPQDQPWIVNDRYLEPDSHGASWVPE